MKKIIVGVVISLFSACSINPKLETDAVTDISKYEDIIEKFDRRLSLDESVPVLSFNTVPVVNRTDFSNHEFIDKLKFMPQEELKKMKSINSQGTSSTKTIGCYIAKINSIIRCKNNQDYVPPKKLTCNIEIACEKGGIKSFFDEVTLNCELTKREEGKFISNISTSNTVTILRKLNSTTKKFEFSDGTFSNDLRKAKIESNKDDGVDRALKLLVDVSLIKLISKVKKYNYQDMLKNIAKGKPQSINSGFYLSDLKYEDIGYDLSVNVPKVFSVDDNISFTIDSNNSGFVYIFYIDSSKNITFLYPNREAPFMERDNKFFTFPKDFGKITFLATKDCKNCEKEMKKIYFIQSREAILDFQEITASQILNIPSTPSPSHKHIPSRAICYPEKYEKKIYDVNFAIIKFDVK